MWLSIGTARKRQSCKIGPIVKLLEHTQVPAYVRVHKAQLPRAISFASDRSDEYLHFNHSRIIKGCSLLVRPLLYEP